jgi:hypothetical protein
MHSTFAWRDSITAIEKNKKTSITNSFAVMKELWF